MIDRRHIIRHLACSYDGQIIAAAEFERFVQIWDLQAQRRLAAFGTTLDFGGTRFAISRNGKYCVAGAYNVQGIALYSTENGDELWRRKDLKKVQMIRISNDDQQILCGFEGKSFESLSLKTGQSKSSLRGIQDMVQSVYDECILIDRKGNDYKLVNAANKQIAVIPRATFAALDFAFGPHKLCVSESGGTVRCFDTTNGEMVWEYNPGRGVHALRLGYNDSSHLFVAITWPYAKGGEYQLVTITPGTGQVATVAAISGSHTFEFCLKGSSLLSSDGKIRDTTTGVVNATLDFFAESDQIG